MTAEHVTAIVPLFNQGHLVERAIRSIRAQDAGAPPVVVVDDGSTDGGGASLEGVRVVRQSNAGVAAARNRGVTEAQTAWVAFLDADDEWKPGFLSAALALAEQCPEAVLVATAYEELRPDGRVGALHFTGVPTEPSGGLVPDLPAAMAQFPPVSSSSVMIRRDVFEEVGGFPQGEVLAEDWDLWVRIALRYPVAFTPSVQAVYHQEAPDRASQKLRFDGQRTALLNTLEAALSDGTARVPAASVRALLNKHRLEIAKHLVEAGRGRDARAMVRHAAADGARPLRCLRWWWKSWFSA